MEVYKNNIKQIVQGVRQYIIPLFQREYVWKQDNWKTLLDNVVDLYESPEAPNHFMGAIVIMPTQTVPYGGIEKLTLIDGQQRLTTIFIMLIAIRNIAKILDMNELYEKINNTLVVNQYEKKVDYYKILPTDKEHDKIAFQKLVNPKADDIINIYNENKLNPNHQINEAYNFFFNQIFAKISKNEIEIEKLLRIIIDKLDIVSIVLSEFENAYFVFESLNATGMKLLPSDLIRNYFMMRVHMNDQKEIYENCWKPLEEKLTEITPADRLPEFIRHYLSAKTNAFINERDIYITVKKQDEQLKNTKKYLEELLKFATYYRKMILPKEEKDVDISAFFHRISVLEVNTSYIFILNCYDDYVNKQTTKKEFITILSTLENYLLRRYVCNIESRELNKFFPTLYSIVKNYPQEQAKQSGLFSETVYTTLSKNTFAENLKEVLKEKSKKYPKDKEFQDALFVFDIYGTGTKLKKAKLILSSIEEYLSKINKEDVYLETLTIEHIMPKTIRGTSWEKTLPENGKDYENYLNKLGNLTLTAYNSELSNKSFKDKKIIYSYSKLDINKYFENIKIWNYNSIDERMKKMITICLDIWKSF